MQAPNLESRIRHASDVVFRELDGEAVLVNLKRGTCFTLDKIGTRIWDLLRSNPLLSEVAATLENEFDADRETIARELVEVVGVLATQGLVSVKNRP